MPQLVGSPPSDRGQVSKGFHSTSRLPTICIEADILAQSRTILSLKFGKILPTELFGRIAEFLHEQRFYGTCANLNVASSPLYDQTLKLLWTAVTIRTLHHVNVPDVERERVEMFERILNAGGTKYIQ